MDLYAFLGLVFAIVCICVTLNSVKGSKNNKGRQPPEPGRAWPLIGHLHLLGSTQLLHRTFGAMADKYGPVFLIRLGIHQALVISSWEAANECFTVNDKIFPTRPRSFAVKLMGYDHAMFGFAPYGPYWREIRKLVTVEILSNRRLELLKHVRDEEINVFVQGLYKACVKNGGLVAVELKERFGDLAMNIIVRLIAGKRYFGADVSGDDTESRRCQKALGDFFYFVGLFLASDAAPCLGCIDYVKGYVGQMKKTARELDCVFESWVQEHRQKRINGNSNKEEHDFIDIMLSIMDEGKVSAQDDPHTVIKATCLSLILGGNDTTVVTLTWVISLLLNNRHALKKAQDELNIHVGKHRQVEESDTKNLIYLQAIVKETLRLYPPLPLSAPREAMEDCTISNFDIPAGTRLFVNLWKLQRDPSVWASPSEFKPERFLKEHDKLDFSGQDFEYIPFGSGRRKCPGISFAFQVLHLTLARLLHAFELGTVSDTAVDMSECRGLTVPKATPLEVTLTPRLEDSLCYLSVKMPEE